MSIKLLPGGARLTVLGSGYSNSSFESGDGLTEDGKLWEDIAGDLGYDFGADVDWDEIAGDEGWADDVIYIDDNGYISSDGIGTPAIPEETLVNISSGLEGTMTSDELLLGWTVPEKAFLNISKSKVSQEMVEEKPGSGRPHKYSPAVYWIQWDSNTAYLFLDRPFKHTNADGGNIEVEDMGLSIRDGYKKTVYWSSCSTQFSTALFPNDFKHIPVRYICWQFLYGTFDKVLLTGGEQTINTQTLKEQMAADNDVIEVVGGARYERTVIDGKVYYKLIR